MKFEDMIGQIICGDCLSVMRDIPDKSIDLVLTDPPYNIGKDYWDTIKNYEEWLVDVFKECERVLKDNGTLFFFHMVFATLANLHSKIECQTSFRHKQLIVINKGLQSVAGRCSIDNLRSFPKATEYLQFYTFEDRTGAEQLSEKYSQINPMAKYLKGEFEKAGIKNGEIAKLFPSKNGGMTGCVSNWLLGLNFPTKEQYEVIRKHLNYKFLRKEYEELRKEYEELRYTFNLFPGLTDVLDVNMYNDANEGHSSQKPVKLIQNILKIASNNNDLILDPFAGSCTTHVACKLLNRRCISIEISEAYCEIGRKRLRNTLYNEELAL